MDNLLTAEQIEKIVTEVLTAAGGTSEDYLRACVRAGYNYAYKESLSFTNEKLVEIIREAIKNATAEDIAYSLSEKIAKALSPYLSTIEQAKKEGEINAYMDMQTDLLSISTKATYDEIYIRIRQSLMKIAEKLISRQALQEK